MLIKLMLMAWIVGISSMGQVWCPAWLSVSTMVYNILLLIFMLSLSIQFFQRRLTVTDQKQAMHWRYVSQTVMILACFYSAMDYAQSQLSVRLAHRFQQIEQQNLVVYVSNIDQRTQQEGEWRQQQVVQRVSTTAEDIGRIVLYLPQHEQHASMQLGQYYQVSGRLKPIHGYAVPQVFDVEKWRLQQNVMATMQVEQLQALSITEVQQLGLTQFVQQQQGLRADFALAVERKRLAFRQLIRQQHFQQAGLLLALLTGDESLLNESTIQQFKTLGIAHLLAISGPHVLIFAMIMSLLLHGVLTRCAPAVFLSIARPYLLIVPFVLSVCLYTAFVGFEIPALRTSMTASLIGGMLLLKQRINVLSVLLISASLMLWMDPFSVLSAAFWLSYGACFILLRVYQSLASTAHRQGLNSWQQQLWQGTKQAIWTLIESQGKIFLALMPLVLLIFQQISWIAPFVNLIAIPLIGAIVVPCAVVAAVLSGIWSPIGLCLFHVADYALVLLIGILNILQQVFEPQLQGFALTPWMLLSMSLGIWILFLPRGVVPKLWSVVCFLPLMFGQQKVPRFELTVLDVGQGQAVLLRASQGSMPSTLLVDTGGSYDEARFSVADSILLPYLHGQGIAQLDRVILTHLDQDHAGAFQKLQQHLPVRHVMSNQRDARFDGQNFEYCYAGQAWQFDQLNIQILSPQRKELAWAEQQQNELSCVVYIALKHAQPYQHFLLMGDAGWQTEYQLMHHYPELKVDVLVLGHHGSQHSSAYDFLKFYHPKLAIASAGFDNRYHHPHPLVLARLKALNIVLQTTPLQGSLSFSLNDQMQMQLHPQRATRQWLIH